jgi:hypothetical protein
MSSGPHGLALEAGEAIRLAEQAKAAKGAEAAASA